MARVTLPRLRRVQRQWALSAEAWPRHSHLSEVLAGARDATIRSVLNGTVITRGLDGTFGQPAAEPDHPACRAAQRPPAKPHGWLA